jgi:hypothetical protein
MSTGTANGRAGTVVADMARKGATQYGMMASWHV